MYCHYLLHVIVINCLSLTKIDILSLPFTFQSKRSDYGQNGGNRGMERGQGDALECWVLILIGYV